MGFNYSTFELAAFRELEMYEKWFKRLNDRIESVKNQFVYDLVFNLFFWSLVAVLTVVCIAILAFPAYCAYQVAEHIGWRDWFRWEALESGWVWALAAPPQLLIIFCASSASFCENVRKCLCFFDPGTFGAAHDNRDTFVPKDAHWRRASG